VVDELLDRYNGLSNGSGVGHFCLPVSVFLFAWGVS
jgi:hypothetical protein